MHVLKRREEVCGVGDTFPLSLFAGGGGKFERRDGGRTAAAAVRQHHHSPTVGCTPRTGGSGCM